ncbi:MAG: hypothetical protein DRQ47_11185, partial [Gammaproteobacteria bacterium]
QIRDATFSHYGEATSHVFFDGDDYSTPEQPASGMVLPGHGLSITINDQPEDSASASLTFGVGEVAWEARFDHGKDFRTVSFANLSSGTGNATASWDFGDDSPLSAEWEPTHTYQSSGDFNVTLTITSASDGSVDALTETVSIAWELTASFEPVNNDGEVTFTASTEGGVGSYQYAWDFGDDSTGTAR